MHLFKHRYLRTSSCLKILPQVSSLSNAHPEGCRGEGWGGLDTVCAACPVANILPLHACVMTFGTWLGLTSTKFKDHLETPSAEV